MGCSIMTKPKIEPEPFDEKCISHVSEIKVDPGIFVQENTNKFQEIYRVGSNLGSGAFGEVKTCFHRDTGQKRAVKIFRKDLISRGGKRQALDQEIEILKQLDHPNIVRVYEFFEDERRLYIVMEYCSGGELYAEIVKRKSFNEVHAAQIMQQILSAVSYMHDNFIIHRDLKPENILLEEQNETMNIKLIDFGAAIVNRDSDHYKNAMGTSYYVAPEVLTGEYNEKCDMWSCGVISYILLSGQPPFEGRNDTEILGKVKIGKFDMESDPWPRISSEAKNFISRLLCPNDERLSASQAIQHPWITQRAYRTLPSSDIIQEVLLKLNNFHSSNKLRDAVYTFITTQCISVQDTKLLREVFRNLDRDGDGKISRHELLQTYTKTVGAEQAAIDVDRVMKEVDTDNNGYINYSEFLKATLDIRKVMSTENLKAAFRMFDKDGNGSISADELRKVLEGGASSSEQVWNDIIDQVDQNGDGEIDLQEFEDIVLSKLS
ncbi:unnamed protein product [Blepharisma stoltei]|uniref:non-specific serine/threonine protein kinase n=1 Tax=Blepharisma stoltei TaxID=1481888 RepID=A0AAU9J8L3_9CILI|nr:unnamed protein product [Blepharisma stoltei]